VYSALEAALAEVHDGRLAPQRAQAMAALARAMVQVVTAGELEERVRDLESLLESSVAYSRKPLLSRGGVLK
jgi:hypothetical protein